MQKLGLIFLILIIGCFTNGQDSFKKKMILPDPVICYASGKVEKNYVAPAPELINKLKSGKAATSDIQVTYVSFPENAKTAFEYAVKIWENQLQSSVPIRMKASWSSLGSTTLASCGPTDYFQNFEGAPKSNRYYTIAATEKITGKELNGNGFDLEGSFNKSTKWYFGTDGQTPDSLYDFVSTVLHEIAHGLGFTGFFYTTSTRGGYGTNQDKTPSVYDGMVETLDNRLLVNNLNFVNPSIELLNALTSNTLYSNSLVARLDGGGLRARLYAPREYNDGSSIYHLNENTYPASSGNALMTHAAGKGEANHDPGKLTLGMIADLGWKNMKINFTKPPDVEFPVKPVTFEASVVSDYPVDSSSIKLYYSIDKFKSHVDSLLMKTNGKPTFFSTNLTIPFNTGIITYFIKAKDNKQRQFTVPTEAPGYVYDLKIGPDTIKPVISHEQPEFIFSNSLKKSLKVKATDNIGIDTVYFEYLINNRSVTTVGLTEDSISSFRGSLNFSNVELKGGDSIRYRIVAIDSSSKANKKILPSTGYFMLKVEGIMSPVVKYYNDFNNGKTDFIEKDFQVQTFTGFSDGALHSPHPYPSPEKDDTYLNLTTYLRYPIILKRGESMSYDEVVLVEPGDPGTKFGDFGFWDYVIAEGSKDRGENWQPFADGYDSGSNNTWLIYYNSSISGNNSVAAGKKELFLKRKINLLENGKFTEGDTVLIRFRILSDPYAHGWGWVIDNLSIQIPVSAPLTEKVESENALIYPNPFKDKIHISIRNEKQVNNLRISVFNQVGQLVSLTEENSYLGNYQKEIGLEHLNRGVYIIVVTVNGNRILTEKAIKQF